jgi:opacity protein-like surface antigen
MKKLFLLITALLAIAAPKAAQALDVEGMYAGGLGGLNFLEYNHHGVKIEFKPGWTAGAFAGYRFCSGIRLEGEAVYRYNRTKSVKLKHHSKQHIGGHLRTWSTMVNGLYDFDVDCWCIVPYLGAGIGYDWTKVSACGAHGNKDGFAWQLIAGGLYPIDDCTEMGLEYRFHNGHKDSHLYNHTVDMRVQWYF